MPCALPWPVLGLRLALAIAAVTVASDSFSAASVTVAFVRAVYVGNSADDCSACFDSLSADGLAYLKVAGFVEAYATFDGFEGPQSAAFGLFAVAPVYYPQEHGGCAAHAG